MKRLQEQPVTFLLVDDREENLVALEALLRRDGLRFLLATSGRQALELLLTNEVALALIDVQMPEMDGFELAELMRGSERSRTIPIIFVTAGGHDMVRMFEGYDAGAVDFLHKPIDPRILKNKAETFFQLCKQRMKLEDTLRFHETFVAALGHDLRNPLNSIGMVGQILLASAKEPDQREMLNRLLSSTRRMTALLDQLYDLSRSRLSGDLHLSCRMLDLAPIVRAVVKEQELGAGQKTPITLEVTGDTRAFCDEPRMSRVVANLVSNAIKHGSGPVKITCAGRDSEVTITVHNQGVIDPQIMDKLFDPFVSARTSRDGLGLGLFIVDQIVHAHGGRVAVSSEQEGGTTFSVMVPAQGKPDTATAGPPQARL